MHSQLFIRKRHPRFLIFISFHMYITISAPLSHHHEAHLHHQCSCHKQMVTGKAEMGNGSCNAKSMCLAQTQPKMPTFQVLCNTQRAFCGIPERPLLILVKTEIKISKNICSGIPESCPRVY